MEHSQDLPSLVLQVWVPSHKPSQALLYVFSLASSLPSHRTRVVRPTGEHMETEEAKPFQKGSSRK